ncbi:MAG TPA: hypothetical protein VGS22_17935 [Thermoanaerobaculia bacterium]|jgi:hypothetical protein|nr:hypothetical protein [Thermoanaerobaculia bacterium]
MRRLDVTAARTLAISLLLLSAPLGAVSEKTAAPACSGNDQCGAEEFCARWVGECGKPGLCEARPKDCAEHGHSYVKPMCGCDGKTYDNACLAAAAGASVDHEGPCAAP